MGSRSYITRRLFTNARQTLLIGVWVMAAALVLTLCTAMPLAAQVAHAKSSVGAPTAVSDDPAPAANGAAASTVIGSPTAFAAALSGAQLSGNVVTLTADVRALNANLIVTGPAGAIGAPSAYALDLNGHKLDLGTGSIVVCGDTTLEVRDSGRGMLTSANPTATLWAGFPQGLDATPIDGTGDIQLAGATVNGGAGAALIIVNSASSLLNGGTLVSATASSTVALDATRAASGDAQASFALNDGAIENTGAGCALSLRAATAVLNGGIIESLADDAETNQAPCVRVSGQATLNLSGAALTSPANSATLLNDGGTVTIFRGEVENTAGRAALWTAAGLTTMAGGTVSGGSADEEGAWAAAYVGDGEGTATFTVTGGTIAGVEGALPNEYAPSVLSLRGGTAAISGGTFIGPVSHYASEGAAEGTVRVNGGAYSALVAESCLGTAQAVAVNALGSGTEPATPYTYYPTLAAAEQAVANVPGAFAQEVGTGKAVIYDFGFEATGAGADEALARLNAANWLPDEDLITNNGPNTMWILASVPRAGEYTFTFDYYGLGAYTDGEPQRVYTRSLELDDTTCVLAFSLDGGTGAGSLDSAWTGGPKSGAYRANILSGPSSSGAPLTSADETLSLVSFNPNGASWGVNPSPATWNGQKFSNNALPVAAYMIAGARVNASAIPQPTSPASMRFAGWNQGPNGSNPLVVPASGVPVSVMAYWQSTTSAGSSSVIFDPNGGGWAASSQPQSVQVAAGAAPSMVNQPTWTGYLFLGWYTFSGGQWTLTHPATTPVSVPTTYYAQWAKPQLTIDPLECTVGPGEYQKLTVNLSARAATPGLDLPEGFELSFDREGLTLETTPAGLDLSDIVFTPADFPTQAQFQVQAPTTSGTALVRASYFGLTTTAVLVVPDTQPIFRLWNPNNGAHLLTADHNEYMTLQRYGWNPEGVAFDAPLSGVAIYRLLNPNNGDHLYTTSKNEYDTLQVNGWSGEGIKLHGMTTSMTPIYRLWNSLQTADAGLGSHLWTADANEYRSLPKLVPVGAWKQEGIAWYAAALPPDED